MSEGAPAAGSIAASAPANAVDPRLHTDFCDLVGVRYPVVQTGMGWVSGARLTAATAQAGGLGILASATMSYDELVAAINKVASRTDAPFGVNLLPNQPDLDRRIDLMISRKIAVASFAGAPKAATVAKLNDAGIVTMVTVGAKRHAEKVLDLGVRCVIAQGGEGGGHTGSVATSLLIPQVADALAGSGVPFVAAGGYFDGRGLISALAYGASGIAMGTRFLLTQESHVPDNVKQQYLGTPVTGTVVTEAIDGAPQRVIRTEMIDALEKSSPLTRFPKAAINALRYRSLTGTPLVQLLKTGLAMRKDQDLTWAQVALAANAPMMTAAAMVHGKPEVGILPTGQVVGAIDELPTVAELFDEIVSQATDTLDRLAKG